MGSHAGATVTVAAAVRVIIAIAASFQSVNGQSCGSVLTGSGAFTSPNYPMTYPNFAHCVWNLASSDGNSAVQLFFGDILLENHYDILEIYSGGILMELYQDRTLAHTAVYSSNVTVVFLSDESGGASGFSIFFNSTSPRCDVACFSWRCITWTPNFPFPFPQGSSCRWANDSNSELFNANGGFFAVESTTVSPVPFIGMLELTRKYSNGSQAVDLYQSPAPIPPVTLAQELVEVKFTSERCSTETGFMLSFSKRMSFCGEELLGNGTFSTPNYPFAYAPLTICIWRLKALSGMRVQLTVLDFQVEHRHDFVRVYSDGQLISSYTGDISPFSLTLGSEVIVDFQSDASDGKHGVLASFRSVP